jgi:hypothetical protein
MSYLRTGFKEPETEPKKYLFVDDSKDSKALAPSQENLRPLPSENNLLPLHPEILMQSSLITPSPLQERGSQGQTEIKIPEKKISLPRRDRESAKRDVEKPAIATASRSEAVRGVKSLWAACCHSF